MDRPIIFSGEMVRALIDGRKTQTRAVIEPQPEFKDGHTPFVYTSPAAVPFIDHSTLGYRVGSFEYPYLHEGEEVRCPFGMPGDKLWVREKWAEVFCGEACNACYAVCDGTPAMFAAQDDAELNEPLKWRSAIYMPRWASRLTLVISAIGVERLQEISVSDVFSEGCPQDGRVCYAASFYGRLSVHPMGWFAALWDPRRGSYSRAETRVWDSNPFVWAIEFTVSRSEHNLRPTE